MKVNLNKMVQRAVTGTPPSSTSSEFESERVQGLISVQWLSLPDGRYKLCGETVKELPPGVYTAEHYVDSLVIKTMNYISNDLARLPDSAIDKVLSSIQEFWEKKKEFKDAGQLFKRGILLWGPAGSGKTSIITLAAEDVIKRGGIVFVAPTYVGYILTALDMIRQIESTRPIVCILEDLDQLVEEDERELLSLLDGEKQIENVVYIATTNNPEKLVARFIRRPSRFDEVIHISMPSENVRKSYIEYLSDKTEVDIDVARWVKDTHNMSIAYIRELFVATCCLGRSYEESLSNLKEMNKRKEGEDDNPAKAGFGS